MLRRGWTVIVHLFGLILPPPPPRSSVFFLLHLHPAEQRILGVLDSTLPCASLRASQATPAVLTSLIKMSVCHKQFLVIPSEVLTAVRLNVTVLWYVPPYSLVGLF